MKSFISFNHCRQIRPISRLSPGDFDSPRYNLRESKWIH